MAITTTPSGGPQGEFSTYTPIYSQTLSSATATITFSNIPQTYTDLVLAVEFTTGTISSGFIQFNGDVSTNYSNTLLNGDGSTAGAYRATSDTAIRYHRAMNGNTGRKSATLSIQNYSNTTTYKTLLSRFNNASDVVGATAGLWRSTSPITSIKLWNGGDYNFDSGATFTLYGIKAAMATSPKATGGDMVTTDGTYWYHTFLSSGTFENGSVTTANVLVVAGGGGGSWNANDRGAGGGGAGGYRANASFSFTPGTRYPVVVGAGGAAGNSSVILASSGSNSSISTLTTTGGGYGGINTTPGGSGGSGGGGANSSGSGTNAGGSGNAGGYSPVEGYAGGSAVQNSGGYNGGGGGGSAGVGSNASAYDSTGTAGGAGTSNSISGTTVTYAAGGRGGGATMTRSGVSGGAGTGNGGEGQGQGSSTGTSYYAGAGGSGIVIVRYAV
jgi:hypothetical protein